MSIEIIPLSAAHVPGVATLHMRYLRSPFQGEPGQRMLEAYYRALITQKGGCGYVALVGTRLAGYVCGVWNSSAVKKTLIIDQWSCLLGAAIQSSWQSPMLWVDLLSRLPVIRKTNNRPPIEGYELRPIVVDEGFRGTGVAPSLISKLTSDARNRGYTFIFLATERDNIPANKFYQKQGFESMGTVMKPRQEYIYYTKHL